MRGEIALMFSLVSGNHIPGVRKTTKGVRKTTKVLKDGSKWDFQTHRWNEWRQSEARADKLHLVDKQRVKMGQAVIKYFQGTMERNEPLNKHW